jgi:hypothetical protein
MTTSKADTSKTVFYAPFAGHQRRFKLPLGKIADLERLCGAGIGAIMVRLATHQFKGCDVWETIRLSLEGGGMSEPEATATCMPYHDEPLMWHVELASRCLTAAVNGVPNEEVDTDDTKKKSESPATSRTSTQQPPH